MADHDETEVSLSDLQLDLMRVLWSREEASVGEIAEALAESRGLAHTTVATLLTRLAKRSLVSVRRDGRVLIYRAEVAEPEVRRSMVGGLLRSVFGGDPKALLAHLVNERDVSSRDLERIRELLARKPGRKP
ncbi:MAG: BlaI/MecI/CopY family transcriptional regulator [Rhodanobacteraceae bacterium]|jgi:predicted transcriptional regulator|nr:BlaI/MecI/CopY family transcriptional regulator [Rhodanobacteraceae bacterium]MBL0039979.1 BlaI/MecI/CopY family transcriptional regulator [Xanthomonadales bacterium]MBP6078426.1 BlaI/MecI/CopY family transcriptional regulator [Xanthomonadales bacterium]MBP7622913.1 BlaI/MecI/CopY family transcriptional regulator [Xanthomonadales bacterium]